ncbi:MAG: hypothetical protein LUQ71_01275 [Methanoregula sp.]|nr:hypothetical protein [Methanoregula sp.]
MADTLSTLISLLQMMCQPSGNALAGLREFCRDYPQSDDITPMVIRVM